MADLLIHFAAAQEWTEAAGRGYYLPEGFARDGFVHLSLPEQAHIPANRVFSGRNGLVLLWIDRERLSADVVDEPARDAPGERFPHLYGALNLDAVVGVTELQEWEAGRFRLPPQPEPHKWTRTASPDTSNLVVRAARIEDLPDLARVHTYSSVAAYAGIAPHEDESVGLARREAAWRQVFDTPGFSQYLAELDGDVVGVLNVGPSHEPAIGELYTIYVHPSWWGTKVGFRLLETAHEQLARDFSEAVLSVLAVNVRARRFYERSGWHLERVQTESHFGGQPVEIARYRKRFANAI